MLGAHHLPFSPVGFDEPRLGAQGVPYELENSSFPAHGSIRLQVGLKADLQGDRGSKQNAALCESHLN
jgi:hypothetical protein